VDEVRHLLGRFVECDDPETGDPRWRYVYGGVAKPYLHPLRTPGGSELTGFQPHSHPWHRGLWFTIKYLNEENFWEEEELEGFGTQRTTLPPTIAHTPHGDTALVSELTWVRPDGATVVLDERRAVGIGEGAIAEGVSAITIDFATILTARCDLSLDRTPFTTWGGYGGLALRLTRACRGSRMLFPDGSTSERPTGDPAVWCDLSGALDGGVRASGGAAVFDHPSNPRHPTPWYGAAGSMNFLNAAFLFHEPMQLVEGDTLAFRFRVLVHDDVWEPDRIGEAYELWVKAH